MKAILTNYEASHVDWPFGSLYWQKLGVLYKFSARGQTN